MVDTIYTVVQTVAKTADNSIELISQVNAFYDSAWNKLIVVNSVILAVVGILVPLVIQWYQKKSLNVSQELLKKEIEIQTSKIKSELLIEINSILEIKLQEFDVKIQKLEASIQGRTFHLQAITFARNNEYSDAFGSYVLAAKNYLICDDFLNLQRVLENLIIIVRKMSLEEVQDSESDNNTSVESLIKELETKNDKGVLTDSIKHISNALKKLPKTNTNNKKPV